MAKDRVDIYIDSDTKVNLLKMAEEMSDNVGVRVSLSQLCHKILKEATRNDKS